MSAATPYPTSNFAEHCPSSTDKQNGHGYGRVYDRIILPCLDRTAQLHVLEIGVHTGGSMRLWESLFPAARVFGIDIDLRCTDHATDRTRVFIGDATQAGVLSKVCDVAEPGFNLIVDDGSHAERDYLTTFFMLFPALVADGVYVVEDMQSSDMQRFHAALGDVNPIAWTAAWSSTSPGRWIGAIGSGPWGAPGACNPTRRGHVYETAGAGSRRCFHCQRPEGVP